MKAMCALFVCPLNCKCSALDKLWFADIYFHKIVKILTKFRKGEMRQELRLCAAVNLTDKINNFSLAHFNVSKYQSVYPTFRNIGTQGRFSLNLLKIIT